MDKNAMVLFSSRVEINEVFDTFCDNNVSSTSSGEASHVQTSVHLSETEERDCNVLHTTENVTNAINIQATFSVEVRNKTTFKNSIRFYSM